MGDMSKGAGHAAQRGGGVMRQTTVHALEVTLTSGYIGHEFERLPLTPSQELEVLDPGLLAVVLPHVPIQQRLIFERLP